jgi:hypothetical protein
MARISRDSLMTLEAYARERPQFRRKVLEHKKHRTLALGSNVTLVFEDELTMRYQIQEMLRAERIFEEAGIQSELDAYNPLVPDGSNWKATMLIEYPEVEERRRMLPKLIGVEDKVWVKVEGCSPVYAIADEDMDRENDEKTSSVHFLRFELDAAMKQKLRAGSVLSMGVDHPSYTTVIADVGAAVRASLLGDLT